MPVSTRTAPDPPQPREWLVANGLGGYASGTVDGRLTRRYHGLLVSAHPAPIGRILGLVALDATAELPDGPVHLGGDEDLAAGDVRGRAGLESFELEHGLPVWVYRVGARRIRQRLVMPHGRNAVSVEYELLHGDPVDLLLRPVLQPRGHDDPVDRTPCEPVTELVDGGLDIRCGDLPTLRLRFPADDVLHTDEPRRIDDVHYPLEAARGYPSAGSVWSPGTLATRLEQGQPLTLLASTDSPGAADPGGPAELDPAPAHATLHGAEVQRRHDLVGRAGATGDPVRARLVLAADSFLFRPVSRPEGDAARSVIAGYHWFTDWGRDTMISLEGLTLATGRVDDAAAILRTFARHTRDGLIPNLFPEGDDDGLYHTADATLWFFHAVHRYVETTDDDALLRELLPTLRDIVRHHIDGTRFGIGVDPADDLLRQGEEGYQLTWMDAKVDGWVVTPRRGKAVEINALWYNALRLLEGWLREEDPDAADEIAERADRTRASFNERFWYEEGGYLYDVIDTPPDGGNRDGRGERLNRYDRDGRDDGSDRDDRDGRDGILDRDDRYDGDRSRIRGAHLSGVDSSFRPNQVFAIALDHPVLVESRWAEVLGKVEERLLTPVGLRSLAPGEPEYRPAYTGDLRSRDAAYHQGTVWGWLIGPFVDAWLRVHPDRPSDGRRFLEGLIAHLDDACVGSLSEIFDAEPPYTPRGCVAQAWTVAEVLRSLVRTTADGSE